MKYNCISLKGKDVNSCHNLLGRESYICEINREVPEEIKILKKTIINQFIIPLCKSNWIEIKENMFNLARLQNRLKILKQKYQENDLEFYNQILEFIIITFSEHLNLQNLENKVYGGSKSNAASFIQKIKYIRLKAEYELYNIILGKPNFKEKEKYRDEVIERLRDLLKNENIGFKEINSEISKYKI